MSETNYCAEHPDTPSNLRCGRCDKLICPRCMVQTPVGSKCRDCAQVRPLPMYDVAVSHLLRAIAVAVGIGLSGGLAFALIVRPLFGGGFIGIAALGGLGYLLAEGISRVSNRKRGRALQYVAAGGMVVALATVIPTAGFGAGAYLDPFDLLGVGLGIYVAVIQLR